MDQAKLDEAFNQKMEQGFTLFTANINAQFGVNTNKQIRVILQPSTDSIIVEDTGTIVFTEARTNWEAVSDFIVQEYGSLV
jgi:rhamnose utilization protein RhaD (predicted bifunctional aldolase and dehydrogenase)